MLQAFIIVLREVLEAALIIGIVLAASRGVPRRGLWVSAGVGTGILGSMVVAAFAEGIAMALEGVGQEVFNAGVLLVATPLLLWTGSLLGLAGGAALGALMYFGLLRIPTRHLFTVTSWMILLLAAGMASQAAGYLVQAGTIPGLIEPLWNSSAWLPEGSPVGAVLHALMGYDDQPSAMQLIFFAVAFIVIASLMRWVDRRAAPAAARGHASREAAPQRS